MKTSATQKSNERYVYETKRQGRIAHHHTDATVPHIVALLGSTFHAAKIETFSETSKYFAIFLQIFVNLASHFCSAVTFYLLYRR